MPYANIHYVKLQIDLLNDKRFIFDCDESQRLLYVGLLMLAGATKNKIDCDCSYLKQQLNLSKTAIEIEQDINHLIKVFPKLKKTVDGKSLNFKNFNRLHNYLDKRNIPRNSEGNPKELQRVMQSIVEYIREKKNIEVDGNPTLTDFVFKRYCKAAKQLALLSNLDLEIAKKAIDWVETWCKGKGLNWELETVNKHFLSGRSCGFSIKKKVQYE